MEKRDRWILDFADGNFKQKLCKKQEELNFRTIDRRSSDSPDSNFFKEMEEWMDIYLEEEW